jgi:hypothetical protein
MQLQTIPANNNLIGQHFNLTADSIFFKPIIIEFYYKTLNTS